MRNTAPRDGSHTQVTCEHEDQKGDYPFMQYCGRPKMRRKDIVWQQNR